MKVSEELAQFMEWARELHEALSKAFEGLSALGRLLVFDEENQAEVKHPRTTWMPVLDTRRPHQVLMRKPIHAPRKIIP